MEDYRRSGRIVGIDLARFFALAGMMAVHILPEFEYGTGDLTLAQSVAGGRASALFAVLAGVSLALTTGRTRPVRGRAFAAAAVGIAVRAVVIAAIGLALGELESGVAVILTYYAALFLLGIPFLVLRARWLFALAAGWLVLSPVLAQAVRRVLPERGFDNPSVGMLQDPVRLLGELTFTGFYPAVPWLTYLLVGLALGRTDLTRRRAPVALAAAGGALVTVSVLTSAVLLRRPGVKLELAESVGTFGDLDRSLAAGFPGSTPTDSWWWLAVRAPHTATPLDLAQTVGSALLVIAACLVVGRLLPSLTAVLFGAGAMTLTLYTVHVVLRATFWDGETTSTYAGQIAAALAVGALFALAHRKGPLESAVGALSGAARRRVAV